MKPDKPRYNIEKSALELFFLFSFLVVFVGSFNYSPESRLFPLFVSTPGLIMAGLYLVRRVLPQTIRIAMEGKLENSVQARESEEISRKPEETVAAEQADTDEETKASPTMRSYLIILFSMLYMLLSYLIGFYISTVVLLPVYFYFSNRRTWRSMPGNICLCLLLLAIVYTFDSGFGHHFGVGVLTE